MKPLAVPSATSGPSALADYLEIRTFSAADRNSSLQDLIQAIRRTGTAEEVDLAEEDDEEPFDRGSETSQSCANDAFGEIEDREESCGGTYPFAINARSIGLKSNPEDSVYTFLLLLSVFGLRAGPQGVFPERLFEEISRLAAENYFGGSRSGGHALHFGFPRSLLPKAFPEALGTLLHHLSDGSANEDAPSREDQKDAKLDIVAWKDFPDKRRGKLIGYGQCAVGLSDWREKLSELHPWQFNQKWLREHPAVPPTRLFFVPFRIESNEWRNTCIEGGVLFDRCRIAALTGDLSEDLRTDLSKWSLNILAGAK